MASEYFMIVSLMKRWAIAAATEEFGLLAGASLGSECGALKSEINLSQQLRKSGRNTDRVLVENAAAEDGAYSS